MVKCKRCGYEWPAKVERPKRCPSCQSYRYDQELKARVVALTNHRDQER